MSKELIVSSTPHETKVAIVEDDEVTEVYFEREQEYSLAGSIYKGRVTRVLPGMQSAFVDIGLERDAFLYVSDFLEETEEYERVAVTPEERVLRVEPERPAAEAFPPAQPAAESPALAPETTAAPLAEREPAEQAPASGLGPAGPGQGRGGEGRHRRRSRRHRGRGKGFPESKYASPHRAGPAESSISPPPGPSRVAPSPPSGAEDYPPPVLPGESLAKYRDWQPPSPPPVQEAPGVECRQPAEESAPPEPEPLKQPEAVEPAELTAPEPSASGEAEPESEAVPGEPATTTPPPEARSETLPPAPVSPAEEEVGETEMPEALIGAEGTEGSVEESAVEQELGLEGEPHPASPGETAAHVEEASVREPAGTPRYSPQLSRRMRRRITKEHRTRDMARPEAGRANGSRPARGQPLIGELLREGQEIIVQIAKEPIGKKGARITSHVALPGRHLVYLPTVDHIGVSRRIASEEERQRLKRTVVDYRRALNMPGGFIVRTAAEGHTEEDLRADMFFLFNLWKEVRAKAEGTSAPALLHRELDLVERILRDQLSASFSTIWVDSEPEYARILDFVEHFQPSLVGRVKLYLKDTPIFEEFGVQDEINKSLKPKVWLKSGGYIVINQTEALVAIDVNTGKYVGRTQRLEDTIVKTNVDAVKEIVRQIRLRDLGGIIVIDFIDMDERKNRQRVMQALEEALRHDRAPSKALAFHDFGLVAITRKRVKQPLEKMLGCACPYCEGSGFVKNPQTVGMEILSEAKKMLPTLERREITLRVNPTIARYLKQSDVTIVQEIEELAKKTVIVKSDPSLHQENFDIH